MRFGSYHKSETTASKRVKVLYHMSANPPYFF